MSTATSAQPTPPPSDHSNGQDNSAEAANIAENVEYGWTPTIQHDEIPYDAQFSNSLMHKVLTSMKSNRTVKASGTSVLSNSAFERAQNNSTSGGGEMVRIQDVDVSALPKVEASSAPVSLESKERAYVSNVPGVKLTHPGGWIEGGTGYPAGALSSEEAGKTVLGPQDDAQAKELVRKFIKEHGIKNQTQLQRAVRDEVKKQNAELRERMERRKEAVVANEKIEREIRILEQQREMERRLERRMTGR